MRRVGGVRIMSGMSEPEEPSLPAKRTPKAKRPAGLMGMLAKAARSQLRRYPRHMIESFRASVTVTVATTSEEPEPMHEPLSATWLGHATVLIRLAGVTILTDPVFAQRIGMRIGKRVVGVARTTAVPPMPVKPPDYILISHAHFDHLDQPTLRSLVSEKTVVIVPKGVSRLIPRGFGRVIPLDWREQVQLDGLSFTALRPKHWGARTLWDRHRRYHGYLIESGDRAVLFAGDTALTTAFDGLRADLAIFGIGAYDPWIHAHATPEQVWAMFGAMRASALLPIHHSTFPLGDEHPDEPLARLLVAAGDEQWRIVGRQVGERWRA